MRGYLIKVLKRVAEIDLSVGQGGRAGVEQVLNLLRAELRLVMREMGTVTIKRISADYVVHEK